jgi:hypothetical protein
MTTIAIFEAIEFMFVTGTIAADSFLIEFNQGQQH